MIQTVRYRFWKKNETGRDPDLISYHRAKNQTHTERVDVIVIGGGPAGTATALSLARGGHKVIVLERSGYDAVRVGETLAPDVLPLLNSLNVAEQFIQQSPIPSPGIVSVWDDREPYENDFIWNPYGNGWHIDRCRFDRMMADAADNAGAKVYRKARLKHCYRDGAGKWQLEALTDEAVIQLTADFLVEATGRNSPPVGSRLSDRVFYDRLVGVVAFLNIRSPDNLCDTRTLVEASENGWWYLSPLPCQQMIVAYMTDRELLKTGRAATVEGWQHLMRLSPYTYARVTDYLCDISLRVVAANTYRRERVADTNHLVVGDAAAAFDPLAGQGIQKALEAGLVAARAINARLEHDPRAFEEYEKWVEIKFTDYLRERTAYYGRVTHWPQSRFWQNRQTTPTPLIRQRT